MQIIDTIALISINETLIVQLFSFLIFVFIINRVMIRPLRGVMADREQHIDTIKQDIVDAQQDLTEKTRQSQAKEARLRADALQFESEMEAKGQEAAATIVAQAETEIDSLRRDAEAEIDGQLTEARKEIQAKSETLALHIMEKVLERSLNP
jgi:F-type H+-transporting ATPase subunit b